MSRISSIRNQPPTIAIVTGQLSQGGAERQLVLLARALKKSGTFTPVVFCLSRATEPYSKVLAADDIEWHAIPSGMHGRIARFLWLTRYLRAYDSCLVYGILNVGNVYGGAAATIAHLPFVGSIRNANPSLALGLRILSGFFCRRADAVIANSKSALQSLRRDLHVQHQRVHIVVNAVLPQSTHHNARTSRRTEWGIPKNALVIGTVGLLKRQKRPKFFVKIAAELLELISSQPLYFVWIGDGPLGQFTSQLLAELPGAIRDHVYFIGSRQDIPDCLSAMDIFLLTSEYEGLPNALLEAMAAGLPCVTTDVPGSRDVLRARSQPREIGILADPRCPRKFAGTVLKLIKDSDRRKQIGINAKQHVRHHYSLEKMVAAHCKVFRQILDQNGNAAT